MVLILLFIIISLLLCLIVNITFLQKLLGFMDFLTQNRKIVILH